MMRDWYPGDIDARDLIGGNHGTLMNGVSITNGKVGKAFTFDGSDDFVDLGTNAAVLGTGPLTIDFWLKTSATRATLIQQRDKTSIVGQYFVTIDDLLSPGAAAGKVCWGTYGDRAGEGEGLAFDICSTSNINDGAYHHLAVTRETDGTARIYIDGALDRSSSDQTPVNLQSLNVYLGADGRDDNNFYSGQLDEVELFQRALSQSEIQSIFNADTAGKCKKTLLINEFRLSGPGGAQDEFVELYNASGSALAVRSIDGTAGWTLQGVTASGTLAGGFQIPNGTVIPPNGHFLGVNTNGFSLGSYPAGNGTIGSGNAGYSADIPSDGGLALFTTANSVNFNAVNRVDSVGFSGITGTSLYFEGGGMTPSNGLATTFEHSLVIKISLLNGQPIDSDSNSADFQLIAPNVSTISGRPTIMGAPGPEKLEGQVVRNNLMSPSLIEPNAAATSDPNRVRVQTPVTNGVYGTLEVRRRYTNNTTSTVSRLRFRITDITTLGSPVELPSQADLRALDSGDTSVTTSLGILTLTGTTIEVPPAQPNGGGLNSTYVLNLPGGVAPGASINVRFVLGVQTKGNFRFYYNIEALP